MLQVQTPRIPRAYYAKRLLEHGGLTSGEFREITGWSQRVVVDTLSRLSAEGVLNRVGNSGGFVYELA